MVTAYLGLGSNLGDRQGNLSQAIERLSRRVRLERVSSLYETEPVGYLAQPRFLNAACRVSTDLSSWELLALAKEIEAGLGRVPGFPNAPRQIDIDILFYGDQVIETTELTVPHPRLAERAFVLIPLAEIAPELVHPQTGHRIGELVARVAGAKGVQKWKMGAGGPVSIKPEGQT